MTDLIAKLATAFITEEPTLSIDNAISLAMTSLGVSPQGVSVHSVIN